MTARPRGRWWRVIDWRIVAAAGVPVWAAAVGLVVWDKARHRLRPAEPAAVAAAPAPAEKAPAASPPAEARPAPAAPQPPPVVVVPVIVPDLARPAAPVPNRPFWLRENTAEEPVQEAGESAARDLGEQPVGGCKTFGTTVRFVKSPTEAMDRARAEDKLVYVLHLSGNLEDEGFT